MGDVNEISTMMSEQADTVSMDVAADAGIQSLSDVVESPPDVVEQNVVMQAAAFPTSVNDQVTDSVTSASPTLTITPIGQVVEAPIQRVTAQDRAEQLTQLNDLVKQYYADLNALRNFDEVYPKSRDFYQTYIDKFSKNISSNNASPVDLILLNANSLFSNLAIVIPTMIYLQSLQGAITEGVAAIQSQTLNGVASLTEEQKSQIEKLSTLSDAHERLSADVKKLTDDTRLAIETMAMNDIKSLSELTQRIEALKTELDYLRVMVETASHTPGPQGPKGDKGDKGDAGPPGPRALNILQFIWMKIIAFFRGEKMT